MADLVIVSFSVTDNTLNPGQSFDLWAWVRNVGDRTLIGRPTVTYFRSTDAAIEFGDQDVDHVQMGSSVFPGTEARVETTVNAPSTAGTYYYGACVQNYAGTFGESDTTNNCSVAQQVVVSN